jgi:hypothetical protein
LPGEQTGTEYGSVMHILPAINEQGRFPGPVLFNTF